MDNTNRQEKSIVVKTDLDFKVLRNPVGNRTELTSHLTTVTLIR